MYRIKFYLGKIVIKLAQAFCFILLETEDISNIRKKNNQIVMYI